MAPTRELSCARSLSPDSRLTPLPATPSPPLEFLRAALGHRRRGFLRRQLRPVHHRRRRQHPEDSRAGQRRQGLLRRLGLLQPAVQPAAAVVRAEHAGGDGLRRHGRQQRERLPGRRRRLRLQRDVRPRAALHGLAEPEQHQRGAERGRQRRRAERRRRQAGRRRLRQLPLPVQGQAVHAVHLERQQPRSRPRLLTHPQRGLEPGGRAALRGADALPQERPEQRELLRQRVRCVSSAPRDRTAPARNPSSNLLSLAIPPFPRLQANSSSGSWATSSAASCSSS